MVESENRDSLPVRYPEFANRLKKAMDESGLSINDIKAGLKVTYEMARRYTLGQAMPRQGRLARLADAVGSTPSYLAFGTVPESEPGSTVGKTRKVVVVGEDADPLGSVRIPKVKLKLSAGIAGFAVEPEDGYAPPLFLPEEWIAKRGFHRKNLIAIGIKGQSMEPSLFDGDTVVINTGDIAPVDGEVYAVNYEGEPVVKRLVKDSGSWWLASDNPDQVRFPRKHCAGELCLLVGRVVRKESDRI